ncbi:hypothetical protein GHK53_07780 [Sinorhizobium meliloti]|uniref:Uncharacterized protein n=1 Tax=Rhizobium meliloti TaxID=382 RepID=A0AAW9TLB7_RHIML|nr:hypothetical protein [Sinorhizobium meliloti]MQW82869.1 hypothetical protein [Sinorhizobium meliloti]
MEARTLRRRCLWQALSAPELASIAVDQSNDKKQGPCQFWAVTISL